MTIPRRKLHEVATRYKLEPSLDDIYVEGSFDKKIIDKAFAEISVHRPVYEIDSVDIPDEILAKHNLTRGNKQEVISLCLELGLGKSSDVIFFIDKDMDHYLYKMSDNPNLVYTQHCDLEGIFLTEDHVREFICDAAGVNCGNWESLYRSIENVVKMVYSLRLAMAEINITKKMPNFKRSLSKSPDEISVNLGELIDRCGVPASKIEILEKSRKWLEVISLIDARNAGRGHDYFEILEWTIKKFNGSSNIAEGLPNLLVLLAPRRAKDIVAPFQR